MIGIEDLLDSMDSKDPLYKILIKALEKLKEDPDNKEAIRIIQRILEIRS